MSLASQFERIFAPKFERRAKEFEEALKAEAPVGETGALRDSITSERKSLFNWRVGVDSAKLAGDPRNPSKRDYSVWVVFGHSGYTIRPVRARVLRWIGKDGQVHYAKYVYVPASKGNNFPARARHKVPSLK